jgi:hypothetical protein
MNLYEIASNYEEAFYSLAEIEDEVGEDCVADTLDGIEGEFQEKGVNIAAYFKNLEAEAAAIKEAEVAMAARRKAIEKRAGHLKEYLKVNMERTGIMDITCPYFAIKVKKCPPSVVIDDSSLIPAEFIKRREVVSEDKAAIKAALKDGDVPGAHLQQATRLEIK